MISVVISTYNGSQTISRAIQSVLDQTYQNFELIVVDDASTDNTIEVIERFGDSRITLVQHSKNSGGPARPKNTGIKNSEGEYIAFLDHDDEWLPTKLEKQKELIKDKDSVDLVACNVMDIYEEKDKKIAYEIDHSVKKNPLFEMLDKSFIHSSSSVIVEADILKQTGGFDENLSVSDDWDLWLRILKESEFDFVDEILVNYYFHGQNLSSVSSRVKADDLCIMMNKHQDLYESNKVKYSELLRYTGNLFLLGDDNKSAKDCLKKSLNISFNLKNLVNYLLSFLGAKMYKKIVNIKRLFSFGSIKKF